MLFISMPLHSCESWSRHFISSIVGELTHAWTNLSWLSCTSLGRFGVSVVFALMDCIIPEGQEPLPFVSRRNPAWELENHTAWLIAHLGDPCLPKADALDGWHAAQHACPKHEGRRRRHCPQQTATAQKKGVTLLIKRCTHTSWLHHSPWLKWFRKSYKCLSKILIWSCQFVLV